MADALMAIEEPGTASPGTVNANVLIASANAGVTPTVAASCGLPVAARYPTCVTPRSSVVCTVTVPRSPVRNAAPAAGVTIIAVGGPSAVTGTNRTAGERLRLPEVSVAN